MQGASTLRNDIETWMAENRDAAATYDNELKQIVIDSESVARKTDLTKLQQQFRNESDNLVLVKKQINAHKSDTFPIDEQIRKNRYAFWSMLQNGRTRNILIVAVVRQER